VADGTAPLRFGMPVFRRNRADEIFETVLATCRRDDDAPAGGSHLDFGALGDARAVRERRRDSDREAVTPLGNFHDAVSYIRRIYAGIKRIHTTFI